jgi:prevent-host-death family protein
MLVNVHDAKTHFSRLLARVEAGEEVVIGRPGVPVARLVPYRSPPCATRRPGVWRGRVDLGPDFDDPLPGPARARSERPASTP